MQEEQAPAYVPLWTKSNHSFLEGASHPEELVERAHALGLPALAITDRDGVYGAVKAHVKAKELGIKLIVGAELTVTPNLEGQITHKLILLAKTRAGYGRLCALISAGRNRCAKGSSLVSLDEVRAAHEELIALCAEPTLLSRLQSAFGPDLYALCARHLVADECEREQVLRARARVLGVPVVVALEVLYHDVARRPLQDVLTCIRHGVTLRSAGTRLKPNREHAMASATLMRERFQDDPAALARTLQIAAACSFSYDQIRYRYPGESLPSGVSESEHLRVLTLKGAERRYPDGVPDEVLVQLERELSLIKDLDYGGYFLTMYELVNYCREQNILCQGRGSAANSCVCFCLGITAIDPVQMDLLFERFLSRERAEPPDIDLDIEHARREQVIQWVYQRYTRKRAAMVANLIRYRARSAVRDVGKALSIPETSLDGIARMLGHYADSFDAETMRNAGLDPDSPALRQLVQLCHEIQEFPRHLSIHPGGFLLGHENVDSIVPIEPATMEGRTVVQWDKYDIEALGLFKVDLLGLGALTAIRHSLQLLAKHKREHLEMATIPPADGHTYTMISRGDTVGVFQIESRAQMAMLPRLKPEKFYDLVIEVAIVRPGPIQGDMVHPYLRRRSQQEEIEYPHASLRRVLEKTCGVPIFQEQVMKLAVLAADYTPGEADQLRRDMAAWSSKGRIEEHHDKLVSRMTAKGISKDFAERVFSQIRGFGEYGFPESHAASFALLAYITAWLKCHHPEVFLCAMLNAQPMGFYAPSTLMEDAARHGVLTLPIDVNHSQWDCTLELTEVACSSQVPRQREEAGEACTGTCTTLHASRAFEQRWAVRMGYRYVKGVGSVEQRQLSDLPRPVRSIETFVKQSRLSLRALVALAEAGAFDSLGVTRREALWRVRAAARGAHDVLAAEPGSAAPGFTLLSLPEEVLWDYRSAQHSTRGHPMAPLRPWLAQRGMISANQVRELPHGKRVDCVGMVICRQRPGTATGVVFLTLEDEQGFVNVVVWTNVFERYQRVLRTAHLLGVRGTIQSAEGVVHLIAEELYAPNLALEPTLKSRDFH
ncbi:MAG TPA: error-prone DNA polymerase [Polyangiales bacterium]